MKVDEAAARLGVTPRRVRAMIADGRIRAYRSGSSWIVEELAAPKKSRALSARSWRLLVKALKLRTLEGLSGQERSRTAARIRRLREADHPSRLLADWYPADAPEGVFSDTLVAHAVLGDDAYLNQLLDRPAEYLRNGGELAQVVASERAILGRTRQWLAETADVPERVVREIEGGQRLASPGQVRRVLRALEIEPTALPSVELV